MTKDLGKGWSYWCDVDHPGQAFKVMQERGLEPLHLSVLAPKTSASANSATPALRRILAGLRLRGQKRQCTLHQTDEFDLIYRLLRIVLGGRDDVPFVLL